MPRALMLVVLLAGPSVAAEWEPVATELLKSEKTGFGGLCGIAVDHATGDLLIDLSDRGLFRSTDKGKTWVKVNDLCPRPFYYGQIRIDPENDQRLYVLGINFHVSTSGGTKFIDGNSAKGTHVDYHALWIDPRDSHHLILGCDGGVNYSYDKGKTWERLMNLPVSQFYAIGVDMPVCIPKEAFWAYRDTGPAPHD